MLNKINTLITDKQAAGEKLPYGKARMKFSVLINYLLHGTSFSEYFAYRFYALNNKEKSSFMTRRYMFAFFDKYNPKNLRERIGDKRLTRQFYGKMMAREQFLYKDGFDAFRDFAHKHPDLFIKRAISWGGVGAYKVSTNDDAQIKEVWDNLDDNCVVEERLENCEEIKRIYPGSLNTIKVLTLWLNNKPEIQTALFRMGYNTDVDNVHLGGICALVDISTGIVMTKAIDNHFREYIRHPVTGEQIIGFKIPKWEAVKKIACEAASVTPEMRYSSWDIAVLEKGPVLIEGNWDAEFYAEQMLLQRGIRKCYCDKLEGNYNE